MYIFGAFLFNLEIESNDLLQDLYHELYYVVAFKQYANHKAPPPKSLFFK